MTLNADKAARRRIGTWARAKYHTSADTIRTSFVMGTKRIYVPLCMVGTALDLAEELLWKSATRAPHETISNGVDLGATHAGSYVGVPYTVIPNNHVRPPRLWEELCQVRWR